MFHLGSLKAQQLRASSSPADQQATTADAQ
jgi:hypothetical protein